MRPIIEVQVQVFLCISKITQVLDIGIREHVPSASCLVAYREAKRLIKLNSQAKQRLIDFINKFILFNFYLFFKILLNLSYFKFLDQNQLQLFPTSQSNQTEEATTSTNFSDPHGIRLRGSFDAGSTPLKHYDYFEESSTTAPATTTPDVEVIIVVVNTTTTPSPFVVDKSERSSAIPADVFSFLSDGDSDRGKPSNTDHSIINNNSDVDAIQRNLSELQAGLPSNSTYNLSDTDVSSQLTVQRNLNYNDYFDKDYSDPEDNYPVDPYSNDDRVYKQGRVTPDERDDENKERVNGRAYKYEYNYQTGDQYDGDEVAGGEIANNQNSEDRSKEIDYRASRDGDGERHAGNRGGTDSSYAIDEDNFEGGQEEGNDEGDLKDYHGKDNGTVTRHLANRDAATDARKSTGHLHKVTAAKPEIESDRGDDVVSYLHGGKTDNDQSIDKSVTEEAGEADDHDDDGDADDGDDDDGLNEVEDNNGDDKHDYGAWNRQRIKMKHDMPDKQENDYEELDEGDDDDDHGAADDDENDEGHKTKAWYAKELSEQMSE